VASVLREVAGHLFASGPVPVWTWSLTEGMQRDGEAAVAGTAGARAALDFIDAHKDAAIFHLKDFHEPLRESAEIRRRLRDLYESCRDRRKFVVITSPVRFIPEELERSICFWNCVRRIWSNWRRFCATSCANSARTAGRGGARPDGGRAAGLTSTKRATRCAALAAHGRHLGPSLCRPCSKRSGCW
jgi:hypothetical protein